MLIYYYKTEILQYVTNVQHSNCSCIPLGAYFLSILAELAQITENTQVLCSTSTTILTTLARRMNATSKCHTCLWDIANAL